MRYTTLIRRLLIASQESRRKGTDVAERLHDRCINGIHIIRETLMNAVCDPRFKMHVEVFPGWKRLAQQHLEAFAEHLMGISGLDEARAYYEMDEMLNQWLMKATAIAQEHNKTNVSYTHLPKDKADRHYQYIKRNLERYVYDDEEELYEQGEQDETDDLLSELSWEKGDESEKVSWDEEEDDGNDEDGTEDTEEEQQDLSPYRSIGKGGGSTVELQNRFLSNVPPSLIRLAKLIGRSGDNIFESSSSFTSSSKSDIAGITTGDDLSSLLPSELAMLSEPATRDIFYRNFVTKRLQVFASASLGRKGKKKKHDGPIIICLDTSSSMGGEPILVAKALTLAICIIAQRRKRKVLVVKYADNQDLFRLHNIERDKKPLLSFLSEVAMGGNNENCMFQWLFDDIMPHEGDYSTADILCISDFGWSWISEEVLEKIEREKQKGMTFYGLNVVTSEMGDFIKSHIYDDFPGSPSDVCDSLWEYENGVCRETRKKAEKVQDKKDRTSLQLTRKR